MNRIFSLMLLALSLPITAHANDIDFTNAAGTLSGSNSGLSLSGSTLIAINGPTGMLTGVLGSLTFSTGALNSGSLEMGGTFAGGGSFVITGNGTNGIPNGVIFSGTFSGPSHMGIDHTSRRFPQLFRDGHIAGQLVPDERYLVHRANGVWCGGSTHDQRGQGVVRFVHRALQRRYRDQWEWVDTRPGARIDGLFRHRHPWYCGTDASQVQTIAAFTLWCRPSPLKFSLRST